MRRTFLFTMTSGAEPTVDVATDGPGGAWRVNEANLLWPHSPLFVRSVADARAAAFAAVNEWSRTHGWGLVVDCHE